VGVHAGVSVTKENRDRVLDAGASVQIVVDASKFPAWKKLEFYDGAHKLGEVAAGSPQFTAENLAAGYHVFSVLGIGPQGNIRPSNPVLVVVRKQKSEAAARKCRSFE